MNVKGVPGDGQKIAALRRAGYPVAVLTMNAPDLSRYMQYIHYAVFGVGYLQNMNFVTQPSVELYKAITNRLHAEAQKAGGIEKTAEWNATQSSPRKAKYRSSMTLFFDRLPESISVSEVARRPSTPPCCDRSRQIARIEYGELTFFGDTRYSARGRAVLKVLERAGERVFRAGLKMPVDIYEGPAMNHSYHEMIIGHGRCLSTVLLSEKAERIAAADYTADYHRAQFLATQMALPSGAVSLFPFTLKDLEETSLAALDEFFREVAALRKVRAKRGDTIDFVWQSSGRSERRKLRHRTAPECRRMCHRSVALIFICCF